MHDDGVEQSPVAVLLLLLHLPFVHYPDSVVLLCSLFLAGAVKNDLLRRTGALVTLESHGGRLARELITDTGCLPVVACTGERQS